MRWNYCVKAANSSKRVKSTEEIVMIFCHLFTTVHVTVLWIRLLLVNCLMRNGHSAVTTLQRKQINCCKRREKRKYSCLQLRCLTVYWLPSLDGPIRENSNWSEILVVYKNYVFGWNKLKQCESDFRVQLLSIDWHFTAHESKMGQFRWLRIAIVMQ